MDKKLRVCHYPQIPCEGFKVEVKNLEEAKLVFDVLANYDMFQYSHNIKPDYSNATVLEMFDRTDNEWTSWVDEDTGIEDLEQYFEYLNK